MAIIKFTNSKSSIKKIYNYITQKSKTDENLIYAKDCTPITAVMEMQSVKNMFNKNGGRQYIHIVQSFDPKDTLSYEKANGIGLELAEYFKGFQAVIATHKDKDHVHNHILLNSVNFETGLKFQQTRDELQKVKDFSDDLCLKHGLSIIKNSNKNTTMTQNEYQVAVKGKSFKIDLIINIEECLQLAKNKETYIQLMNERGYKVNWQENRKYITYTTPSGKKCRDNKLRDYKYSKEAMEYKYSITKPSEKANGNTEIKRERNDKLSKSVDRQVLHNTDRQMELPNGNANISRETNAEPNGVLQTDEQLQGEFRRDCQRGNKIQNGRSEGNSKSNDYVSNTGYEETSNRDNKAKRFNNGEYNSPKELYSEHGRNGRRNDIHIQSERSNNTVSSGCNSSINNNNDILNKKIELLSQVNKVFKNSKGNSSSKKNPLGNEELSARAKKEWYLLNKDKGLER